MTIFARLFIIFNSDDFSDHSGIGAEKNLSSVII